MSENTLVNDKATDATVATTTENQAPADKSYSQKEVDDMMARMKGSLQKKLLKPYEDLGDPETLRQLKAEAEAKAQEQAIKRGEFEATLKALAAKKDLEIQKRDVQIREYKVNTPLLNAAAKHRSVNPEQVRQLLSNRVKLNDQGDVEVLDDKGSVMYNDKGLPVDVDTFVGGWLSQNAHFQSASATTTNSKSSMGFDATEKFDISKLDMKNPNHRKIYAEAKAKGKI
jgi:hypothetical protein